MQSKNSLLASTFMVTLSQIALTQGALAQGANDVITVTATKRAENVQDVPISISAYSEDFLAKSEINNIQDLALFAPNFSVATSSQRSNARIVIRGIGSAGNTGIEPSVGVFIDGVYYPRPGSALGSLVGVSSVEVLRGPQGTLFGRNTAAGALNISTKDPSNTLEGHLKATAGNFDAYAVEGSLAGPLSDNIGGIFSLRYSDRDGYGENLLNGKTIGQEDELALRGKLSAQLTDTLQTKLLLDYNKLNTGGPIIELDPATASPAFDATTTALFGATPTTTDGLDYNVNQDHQDDLSEEQWGLSLDISYDWGDHTIRSITAYREWDADNFSSQIRLPADVVPSRSVYSTETLSQELQIISPLGQTLEYVAGVFYYKEDYSILETADVGAQGCVPLVAAFAGPGAAALCASLPQSPAATGDFSQSLNSIAGFAQATVNITDKFSFTLGGRYTSDDKDGSFIQTLENPVIAGLFRAPENHPDLSLNDSAFTWLASASYDLTDDLMVFATYSTGFKGGGFNSGGAGTALSREARIFQEETSQNVEVGLKSQFWDKRATANVTYFWTSLDDFQDRSFDGLSFITRNAGERVQSGVEADITLTPTDNLKFIGGASYLDAEFESFVGASPLPGSITPQDLSGERPHYSPKWQGSLVAEYSDELGQSGLDWFVRAGFQYVGEQNIGANTNNNPQSLEDSYTLMNLRLGLNAQDSRWQFAVFAQNLTDEAYCQARFDQPLAGAFGGVDATNNTIPQRCVLASPRTFGGSVQFNF